jgi:integrase
MSKIFVTAKKWGFFAGDNPAIGVDLPEKKAVREKHILFPEQIPPLLAALEEPARTMVLVGVLTGLRIGEILALRWKDIDFRSGEIRIEQAYYRGLIGTPKTKNSRRTLPMPDSLKDELKRLSEKAKLEEHLIFQTRNGTPFSDTNLLHQHLKPVGRKLGMPWLNWHTLRRTHATLFQQAGGTLREAQAQLGHSKMSTTLEIYTISIPQAQRKAVENLSDLVTNGDELAKLGEKLPLASERIQ